MIAVLEVLPGELRIASEGLFRVVIHPGNQIHREVLPHHRAAAVVEAYNSLHRDSHAEAVAYDTLLQDASS